VELGQISKYELVKEADAMGLSEKEAMKYFYGNEQTVIGRDNYFKLKKRVQIRKRKMVFTIARFLPEVHVTQISSLQLIKKKVYSALMATGDPFEIVALAKQLIEIERTISEYNGWTQKLTEETLAKYGNQTEEQSVSIPF